MVSDGPMDELISRESGRVRWTDGRNDGVSKRVWKRDSVMANCYDGWSEKSVRPSVHRSRFLGSARRHFYVSLAMSPSVNRTRSDSYGISSSIGSSDTIGRDFWGPRVDTSTTFHSLCLHRSIGQDLIHMESVRPSVHRTRPD